MKCSRCGSPSEVDKTRPTLKGTAVRRIRVCTRVTCKHEWVTHEFEATRVEVYVPRGSLPVIPQ